MISYGVASSIWIQNILIWLVGTVLGFVFLSRNKEKRSSNRRFGLFHCYRGFISFTILV